ncbi:uncharacterized protein LOC111013724 [Momordica charantia]|uniref:Mitochondrial import inner membrane translocase subunit TIM50 n=1 Tax=Momordica charantia TaxID=3673 RepID=A0A6J1CRS6_MOMCH|nr:uncharacterized protein LOC111013724 [Momordica charantia]
MAETSSKNKALLSGEEEEDERGDEGEELHLELSLQKLNLGPKKKLLILGLGGFLCHRVFRYDRSKFPKRRTCPDASYGSFHVYKRPHCEEFIKFCLERFEVGIWSSAREWYMNNALDSIMIGLRGKLLFAWDQTECTRTCFFDLEKKERPIFLKELKKVWLLRTLTKFSSSNTLLIDKEPYKALLNPPHTAIFPNEYKADDVEDGGFKCGSDLRLYLEKLAEAEDVPGFVKGNPFGKPAISPRHPNWDFYSKIIRKYQRS